MHFDNAEDTQALLIIVSDRVRPTDSLHKGTLRETLRLATKGLLTQEWKSMNTNCKLLVIFISYESKHSGLTFPRLLPENIYLSSFCFQRSLFHQNNVTFDIDKSFMFRSDTGREAQEVGERSESEYTEIVDTYKDNSLYKRCGTDAT